MFRFAPWWVGGQLVALGGCRGGSRGGIPPHPPRAPAAGRSRPAVPPRLFPQKDLAERRVLEKGNLDTLPSYTNESLYYR